MSAQPIPTSANAIAGYGPEPQYPIESVDNALLVLLLLREHAELRLTDVSRYLGVASSTAHRVLSMLQYRGLLQQDPASRAYGAGPVLDELAFGVMRRLDVRATARPVLGRLHDELQETVHLGQLDRHRGPVYRRHRELAGPAGRQQAWPDHARALHVHWQVPAGAAG